MLTFRHWVCWTLAGMLAAASVPPYAATGQFKDPLDTPASASQRGAFTQLNGIARAGNRLVAVGIRGLILVSDDGGGKWAQAKVPVASDLLDVYFPTARDGWAVGHDGVVLHTSNGGDNWEKQLDGRMAAKLLTAHFQALADAGDPQAAQFLHDTELNYKSGPEQALLSVWFQDTLHGFVAGSFGTLLATDDGGKTWQSRGEFVEADIPLHYNAIRGTKSGLLIASEKGIVFRRDPASGRFLPMHTGYAGTFFNLVQTRGAVLALGLQGAAYRLPDGESQWQKLETGVASAFTGSAVLPDGHALIVTQTGQLFATLDDGSRLRPITVTRPMLFTGAAWAAPGKAAVVGNGGLRLLSID